MLFIGLWIKSLSFSFYYLTGYITVIIKKLKKFTVVSQFDVTLLQY